MVSNRYQLIRDRASRLTPVEFVLVVSVVLIALLLEFAIGLSVNINGFVLATYILFLWLVYALDTRFVVEYFWLIVMATLNIVGAFCCDESIFLVELNYSSSYRCVLSPLVAFYIVLFAAIELFRLRNVKASKRYIKKNDTHWLKVVLLIGIALELYLLIPVASNPYFIAGASRLEYAQNNMSTLSVSLRTYLPMFLPIAVMEWKDGSKKLPATFLVLLVLFYFLEGDKFGAYLFAAYIVALSSLDSISEKTVSKVVKILFVLFCALIGIVYTQRILLFDENLSEVIEYLSQRLAQQGEVWWSVYSQLSTGSLQQGDLSSEINAILNPSSLTGVLDFGQWKMMSVACGYSEYSAYRIMAGNPFTSTTPASLVYYFGYIGAIGFYMVFGVIYAVLIRGSIRAFSSNRVLESIIYVKLVSVFGNIITASDLTYLFSVQGFVYLGALFCLTLWRNVQESRSDNCIKYSLGEG